MIKENLKGYIISAIVLEFIILMLYLKFRDILMLTYSLIAGPILLFIFMMIMLTLLGKDKK